jgi:hypothetical protein
LRQRETAAGLQKVSGELPHRKKGPASEEAGYNKCYAIAPLL